MKTVANKKKKNLKAFENKGYCGWEQGLLIKSKQRMKKKTARFQSLPGKWIKSVATWAACNHLR